MEPANIAELRRSLDLVGTGRGLYCLCDELNALLARSERLERAVELLRECRPMSYDDDSVVVAIDALLAEHDAAKGAT